MSMSEQISMPLFSRVVLSRDLPTLKLRAGDIATLVEILLPPNSPTPAGAILEIFNAIGESLGTAVVSLEDIHPLTSELMPTTRLLAQAS